MVAHKKLQAGLPASARRWQVGLPRRQAGQILLIVILVIVISSTVGLSLVSRSITSLRTSTEEAESQKAFSAAEAGIERALQGDLLIGSTTDGIFTANKSKYRVDIDQVFDSIFLVNGGNTILKNDGADIWFVDHTSEGEIVDSSSVSPANFRLYWGTETNDVCDTAAMQVMVFAKDSSGNAKTYRYAFDGCSSRRDGLEEERNNFTPSDSSGPHNLNGILFGNKTPVDNFLTVGAEDIIFVRAIPLYKDTVIGVDTCDDAGGGCTSLPSQGKKIISTGTSGTAKRKLEVFKGYTQIYLPYISYGLFVAE